MAGTGWGNVVARGARDLRGSLRGRVGGWLRRVAVSRRLMSRSVGRQPGLWWWLVIVLVGYVAVVALASERQHVPLMGLCVRSLVGTATYCPSARRCLVVDLGQGLEVVTPEHPEYDAISQTAHYGVHCFPSTGTCGLVAPVVETARVHLFIWPNDADRMISEEEMAPVRAIVVKAILDGKDGLPPLNDRYAEMLRNGTEEVVHILPFGLLHDGAFAGALWVMVGGWSRVRLAKRIAKRVRLKGLCPACLYSVETLVERGVQQCPECGKRIG